MQRRTRASPREADVAKHRPSTAARYRLDARTKLLLSVAAVPAFQALFVFAQRCAPLATWCARTGTAPGEAANRVTSNVHALVVASTSLLELVLRRLAPHSQAVLGAAVGASRGVGEAGIAFSVGYMAWDASNMVVVGIEPLVPLLLHHALSGVCLALNAFVWPEGIWINCLLLLTELAVSFKDAAWALELDQRVAPRPQLLRASRVALLCAWVLFRCVPFPYFFRVLHGHRAKYASRTMVALAWGIGVALSVFNLEGLRIVALPGFPWRA